ncbi:polyketide synthase, partial [Pedobacter jeongneungensis]|uniref:polyketide synthase n=1 Tax=Pedobacter jeongneungensis TaxID=947309 RepID=UPI0031F03C7B
MIDNLSNYTGLEIALIGIACRFPGAKNSEQYWDNLINKVESIHFYSDEELLKFGVDKDVFSRSNFVKTGSTLDDKDLFDSSFFDYTPTEANLMNPEHRIFHECVWAALEDAGYYQEKTKGLIGLFAGAADDLNWKIYSKLQKTDRVDDFTKNLLINKDFLTSLISYKLNLHGASFTVNTACSTSLVAINLACKSLLLGECTIALAGGVSIHTQKQKGYLYQDGMIASSDGHCRAFDKNA